jgi:hypothetical protein
VEHKGRGKQYSLDINSEDGGFEVCVVCPLGRWDGWGVANEDGDNCSLKGCIHDTRRSAGEHPTSSRSVKMRPMATRMAPRRCGRVSDVELRHAIVTMVSGAEAPSAWTAAVEQQRGRRQ